MYKTYFIYYTLDSEETLLSANKIIILIKMKNNL